MDAWARQRVLGRTTIAWAALSIAGGVVAATRRDPWWRAFGQQQVGWGVIDLGIVVGAGALQRRRMRALPNPYAPTVLARERRHLRTVLVVNAVADVGYCVLGVVMARRSAARVAGAGAGIVVQGAFLLVHDTYHAVRAGR